MTAADPPPGKPRGLVATAVRTWLRYVVPLTVLSAIAFAPQVIVALRLGAPNDPGRAQLVLRTGWAIVATAWLSQLVLVGPAAAIVGARPGQLRALIGGLGALVRAIVPCAIAAAAIALGGLAFVGPGLALLALLSLTAASAHAPLPAPLLDSIAVVRTRLPAVVAILVVGFALDAAIGFAAQRALIFPFGKPPTAGQLASVRSFVRVAALALIVVTPLPATLLATLRARG